MKRIVILVLVCMILGCAGVAKKILSGIPGEYVRSVDIIYDSAYPSWDVEICFKKAIPSICITGTGETLENAIKKIDLEYEKVKK